MTEIMEDGVAGACGGMIAVTIEPGDVISEATGVTESGLSPPLELLRLRITFTSWMKT